MPIVAPVAVMIHVPEASAGLAWYQAAFPAAAREQVESEGFEYLKLGDIRLEFVPIDEKVGAGPCGTVIYWSVTNFNESLAAIQALGATLYRTGT